MQIAADTQTWVGPRPKKHLVLRANGTLRHWPLFAASTIAYDLPPPFCPCFYYWGVLDFILNPSQ